MTVDLAIVFTPVGGGHKAAALAVAEAARLQGLSIEVLDLFEYAPRVIGDIYATAHVTGQVAAPQLYGHVYFAANRRGGALEPIRRGFDHLAFADLERKVRALAPSAVIATHHLPLVVLGRSRRRGKLLAPVVGVVTDYTAHACWAEKGIDAFCVACPLARNELVNHGVCPDRVAMTGIPVRGGFAAVRPVHDPRCDEPLRVLVTSGGFAIGPMRSILRSFAGLAGVELTVVCGAAEGMVRRLRRDAAASGVRARVLGFEQEMPSRVAEAHIVVGKAGGLTVSETLTAGRPMILVGTVPGNERFNEELVVQGGAGFAACPERVGALAQWMRTRAMISPMGGRARQLLLTRTAERVLAVSSRVVAHPSNARAA